MILLWSTYSHDSVTIAVGNIAEKIAVVAEKVAVGVAVVPKLKEKSKIGAAPNTGIGSRVSLATTPARRHCRSYVSIPSTRGAQSEDHMWFRLCYQAG